MKPERIILFSDLDGTLLDTAGRVSPENRAAIADFTAAGGLFALSTGRAPLNARACVGDLPVNAPSVVFNGAGAYDFIAGEYISCRYMDRELVDPVLRRAVETIPGLDLQVYTAEEIIYCTPEETAQQSFLKLHLPVRFAKPEALEGLRFIKSVLCAPPEQLPRLGELLRENAEGRFSLTPGAVLAGEERIGYYEIMPPGTAKGAALRALRPHPAFAGRTVLAVGDYWNDYELLAEADVPICPANAIDEIKAICRFVSASNNGHAIKHIIERIVPSL